MDRTTQPTSAMKGTPAHIATACWLALLAGSFLLNACNTTEGVGKDLKSAGEGIEDAAKEAKN